MASFERTLEVGAAPEAVFAYMADFSSAASWDPSVVEAERLDEGPVGEGSRFRLMVAFYGRRIELTYELVTHHPHELLVMEADSKRVRSRDEIRITPRGEGSTVHYQADLELKGWVRVFNRGLQVAFGGMGERAAEGLQRELEALV